MKAKDKIKYGRRLIFCGQDDFGPIEVVENDQLRSLHFGSKDKQSEMSLANPYDLTLEYTRLMALSLLFFPSPKSILILGLGGGSLAKFIWKHFPACHLDLVERSPQVVRTSYDYFNLPESSRLSMHLTDALDFMIKTRVLYDMIFVDLFQGSGLSALLGEKEFFRNCQQHLKAINGILICNIWNTKNPIILNCIQQLSENFNRQLFILPDKRKTNYILMASNQNLKVTNIFKITQNARDLQQKTGLNFIQMIEDLNYFKDYGI